MSDSGDVLVVKPSYKAGWEFPGGVVETGETPAAACARECLEELGLELDIGRLLVVDHQSIDGRGDSTMYIYEGPCLASDVKLVLPGGEITEAKFVHPSEIPGLFPARIERRVRAALEAKSTGSTTELHGSFSRVAP
jgi:8-oxo-dGTP pyrophosphatase MutT (NUDIX family)